MFRLLCLLSQTSCIEFLKPLDGAETEYQEEIDCSLEGTEMTVGFNPEYLAAGIEAVTGDEITIQTTDPQRPAVLRGVGAEDYLYLVMPQRLTV